jgi:hypothetical protein
MANMYPGKDQLSVHTSLESSLSDKLFNRPRPAGTTGESCGAERTLSITTVLNLQPTTGTTSVGSQQHSPDRFFMGFSERQFRDHCRGNGHWIVSTDHGHDTIHVPKVSRVQCRRAAYNYKAEVRMAPVELPDESTSRRICCGRNRTSIEYRRICNLDALHDASTAALELLPHAFRIVLVGFAPKRIKPDGVLRFQQVSVRIRHDPHMHHQPDVAQSESCVNHLEVQSIQVTAWR